MVIGKGMIAKAFSRFCRDDRALIFASGVANSGETDKDEFERERSALDDALRANPEKLFVYFSTCSIDDKDVLHSPYVQHKLCMEDFIVRSHKDYLICRLPQVVGRSMNRATLVNYLYDKIMNSERFVVWKNAHRYLVDVEDVAMIVSRIIDDNVIRNTTVNIVSRPYSVLDIVTIMENLTGKRGIYDVINKGTPYRIDDSAVSDIARKLNISFDRPYLDNMLLKYYGKHSSST